MRRLNFLRLGPIARLSLGLTAVFLSALMVVDLWFSLVPATGEVEQRIRYQVAQNLAIQTAALLEAGHTDALRRTFRNVAIRNPAIKEVVLRSADGSLVLRQGADLATRATGAAQTAPEDLLRVPIAAGRSQWGSLSIRFAPSRPTSLVGWVRSPAVLSLLVLGLGVLALSYAYLRRAMHYLNPSSSVPDRVRSALDALAEGLVIVDRDAKVVLANRVFRDLLADASAEINGQDLGRIECLREAFDGDTGAVAPWVKTLRTGEMVPNQPLDVTQADGTVCHMLVSSTAVLDNRGQRRGCLITFDDVTAVHRSNEELRRAMAALETSRQRIEEQNRELHRLATRDGLTGCLNRRAFFEQGSEALRQAQRMQTALHCMMIDIDHFKRFNDTHGHAIGDQVIQSVARRLAAQTRQVDLVGRYGGEEFCIIVVADAGLDAVQAAERIRMDIEAQASSAIRGAQVGRITASVGVASLDDGAKSLEALVEQADQALYASKRAGRNRVTRWREVAAAAEVIDP